MEEIHLLELEGIRWLQGLLRGTFLDLFFMGWNFVDTFWFSSIFLIAIVRLVNRREGISLLFLMIMSYIANSFLKGFFELPRPCQLDPFVGVLNFSSFGFPSGAAQTATIIVGVVLARCKKISCRAGVLVFASFLCFSRIYLGLHFFTDILAGSVVGAFLLAIYFKVFPHFEDFPERFAVVFSLLVFGFGGDRFLSQAAILLGVSMGLLFTKELEIKEVRLSRRLYTFLVVLAGCSLGFFLAESIPGLKSLFLSFAGFWMVYRNDEKAWSWSVSR